MPLLDDLDERAAAARRAWRSGRPRCSRVDQARVAGRLPQPQQRLEHLRSSSAPRPVALDAAEQRRAVVVAQLVVQRASARARARRRASARSSAAGPCATCSLVRRRMNGAQAPRERRHAPSSSGSASAAARERRRGRACPGSGTRRGSTARRGGSRPACRSAPGDGRPAAAAPPSPTRCVAFLIACASSRMT